MTLKGDDSMRLSAVFTAMVTAALLVAPVASAQSPSDEPFHLLPSQFVNTSSYLGVRLSDIDADRAKTLKLGDARGVEITRVEIGSPADKAGIKAGDVLLTYNGENILGAQQLGRLVAETPIGRRIRIDYWRNGRTESTVVTTAAAQHPMVRVAPITGLDLPDMRNFVMPDVPEPMMIWKNSMLGVKCEPIDAQLARYFGVKEGVLIRSVDKNSPGDKAGIRAGDVLTSIDSHAVNGPRDLSSFTRTQREPRNSVSVTLVRDHKEMTLNVPVSQTPE
jgi:serine protease Do